MNISARDLGILLLGVGVLVFSLVLAHFYLTEILPQQKRPYLTAYCLFDKNKPLLYIQNNGSVVLKDVGVHHGNSELCHYTELPPGSSVICDLKKGVSWVEVSGLSGSQKVMKAVVCRGYGPALGP